MNNLTLLLPVYNGGEDFQKILKSLEDLNSRTNVIIYNDGSVDDSYKVMCEFAERSKHHVLVIDGKKNRGYFRAIKILLKIYQTEFFLFLGHDDQLSNNYLDGFEKIAEKHKNIACIFSDISTITPEGQVSGTWPNIYRMLDIPAQLSCREAMHDFHRYCWGNLFVAIWSRQVLSYKTMLNIMRCIPCSSLTAPLKRVGFLNDHMAVLRALSSSIDNPIFYNKTGTYYKKADQNKLSEGGRHFKEGELLHNPCGYLSVVAHFMLPQIKQKSEATLWMLRYSYIYLGISIKTLLRNPRYFEIKLFLRGIGLILTGYVASLMGG